MRLLPFAAVAVVALAAPLARGASGPCTVAGDCVAGQTCRVVAAVGTCTWEAIDGQSLINAINAAHADVERDVILIGDIDETGVAAPVGAEIHLEAPFAEDAQGARALPKIRSAITIEGLSAETSIIDIDSDMRMFFLEVDPLTQRRPDLLLRNLTLRDARPSGGGGAGAVTVTATPTAPVLPELPELPVFVAEDVVFVGGRGGTATAGAIQNDGAPLRLEGCTFAQNSAGAATAAGAVATSTGGVILLSTFENNQGVAAGALAVKAATRLDEAGVTVDVLLQVNATTFEDNAAPGGGAIVSLATTTTLGNCNFRGNVATEGRGGAYLGGTLRVQAGVFEDNAARDGGGAIAVVDSPPSGPIQIAGADFRRNLTGGSGGALDHVGAVLTVDQCFFEDNRANGRGGAVSIFGLTERNGAVPDARITANVFRGNLARPAARLASADTAFDERGNDPGRISLTFRGEGGALSAASSGVVDISDNCVIGNGGDAIANLGGVTMDATANWWGDSTGAGPAGLGDVAGTGITTSSPLQDPADACITDGTAPSPQVFVAALLDGEGVSGGLATIVEDFAMLDSARGLPVLAANSGDLLPDLRLGTLDIDLVGVNDVDPEGAESIRFSIVACDRGDCPYSTPDGPPVAVLTLQDNGDGSEGEGEGEGEACAEVLSLSASSLQFAPDPAAPGEPVSQSITVTNDSPCEVQLLRPFVQAGASQGFSVAPILQKDLLLAPGAAIDVVVLFTPPGPEDEASAEPPLGLVRIETAGGTLVEVELTVAQGCSCAGSRAAPPSLLLALLLVWVLPKPRRIP